MSILIAVTLKHTYVWSRSTALSSILVDSHNIQCSLFEQNLEEYIQAEQSTPKELKTMLFGVASKDNAVIMTCKGGS